MTTSYKGSICLNDVEKTLTARGVKTFGVVRIPNHPREYYLQCATMDDYTRASAWCKAMSPRFNNFKIICYCWME